MSSEGDGESFDLRLVERVCFVSTAEPPPLPCEPDDGGEASRVLDDLALFSPEIDPTGRSRSESSEAFSSGSTSGLAADRRGGREEVTMIVSPDDDSDEGGGGDLDRGFGLEGREG